MIARKATADDAQAVYGLICELEEKEILWNPFKEVYFKNINNPSVFYFVCENENHIVAFASLHIQSLLHHISNVAEIQELIVKKEDQGGGIGRELFLVLIKTARENSCELLEVCCNQKRIRSHDFYKSCGMINSHYKFTYPLDS
jgi:(aminoalkyl)phosphonate N-acetyltransferase